MVSGQQLFRAGKVRHLLGDLLDARANLHDAEPRLQCCLGGAHVLLSELHERLQQIDLECALLAQAGGIKQLGLQ